MSYNNNNKLKTWKRIAQLYLEVKQEDITDTFIVSKVFPKHNIFISMSTWKTIKGMKPSDFETGQADLFEDPDQINMFPEQDD